MIKELYYSLADAENAASVFTMDHEALWVGMDIDLLPLRGTIEMGIDVDYVDPRFEDQLVFYPGIQEVDAIRVVEKESLKDIALFGYLEDMAD